MSILTDVLNSNQIGIKTTRDQATTELNWLAENGFATLGGGDDFRVAIAAMGRQHVRKDVLWITQQKTGQEVHIPGLPELKAVLDVLPLDNLSFLVTAQGRPFTPAGFTNWFREMVREAGLPDGLSPHGLRKATCRRLAEAGCTPHQIMAISGHKSLAEVTRYTVAAGRRDLAAQAMLALGKKEG